MKVAMLMVGVLAAGVLASVVSVLPSRARGQFRVVLVTIVMGTWGAPTEHLEGRLPTFGRGRGHYL